MSSKVPQALHIPRTSQPLSRSPVVNQPAGGAKRRDGRVAVEKNALAAKDNERVVRAFDEYIHHEKTSEYRFVGKVYREKDCNTIMMLPPAKEGQDPRMLLIMDSDKNKLVGAGGFGQVFEAFILVQKRSGVWHISSNGDERLVKCQKESSLARKEADLWAKMSDSLGSVVADNKVRYMDMTRVKGKSLDKLQLETWPDSEKLKLALAILSQGAVFSEGELVHRDLKPANIVYDDRNGGVFFIDFGLLGFKEKDGYVKDKLYTGTLDYLSPEAYSQGRHSVKSDVFAFGITLMNLFSEHPVYTNAVRPMHDRGGELHIRQEYIMRQLGKECPLVRDQAYGLFIEMLAKDPALRPDIKSCLERLNQIYEYYQQSVSFRKTEERYHSQIKGYQLRIAQLEKRPKGETKSSGADCSLAQDAIVKLKKQSDLARALLENLKCEATVQEKQQKEKVQKLKEQCLELKDEKKAIQEAIQEAIQDTHILKTNSG